MNISEGLKFHWHNVRKGKKYKERAPRVITPENREKMNAALREKWKDPVFRERNTPKPGIHPYKKSYPITKEEWERQKKDAK